MDLVSVITALWKHLCGCADFVSMRRRDLANEISFRLFIILPNTAAEGVNDKNYLKAHCIFLICVGHERVPGCGGTGCSSVGTGLAQQLCMQPSQKPATHQGCSTWADPKAKCHCLWPCSARSCSRCPRLWHSCSGCLWCWAGKSAHRCFFSPNAIHLLGTTSTTLRPHFCTVIMQ